MKTFGISHTRWERDNLFTGQKEEERRKTKMQSYWTNWSIFSNRVCFSFSQMGKLSARIRWFTHRSTLCWFWPHKIVMKTNHSVHIMVFLDGHLWWWYYVSFHFLSWSKTEHEGRRSTSSVWTRHCCSGSREWLLEDPTSGNRTAPCHTSRST